MKIALITGGAKRIGRAIAIHLSKQGWKIIIHYKQSYPEAQALAEEIGGVVVQADLAQERDLKQLFEKLDCKIDLLINNASVFEKSRNDQLFYKQLANTFAVNFYAPVQLTMDFFKKYNGSVINILDAAVDEYGEEFIGYSLSKKALGEFTRKLAFLEIAKGSKINAIALGPCLIKAGQSKEVFDKFAKKYPTSIKDVCNGLDYILCNNKINGEILDLTKWN
jgi:NAD(P)-dependent dehydrogenase (short-subunit alcohol dehydrogenase family)